MLVCYCADYAQNFDSLALKPVDLQVGRVKEGLISNLFINCCRSLDIERKQLKAGDSFADPNCKILPTRILFNIKCCNKILGKSNISIKGAVIT